MLQPRALDYERARPKPAPFWRRNRLLWGITDRYCYSLLVIGPLFVVMGFYSFYTDPSNTLRMHICGVAVQTAAQKTAWTLGGVVMSGLGVWFVAWHRASERDENGDIQN
jgi:hypothetical protein